MKKVIRCETKLTLAAYRTQLFNPGDIDNVKKIQARYGCGPFRRSWALPHRNPRRPLFSSAITHDEEKTSLQVFSILNFILQFCRTDPTETKLMARFAKIGIGAGKDLRSEQAKPGNEDGFRAGHRRRLG